MSRYKLTDNCKNFIEIWDIGANDTVYTEDTIEDLLNQQDDEIVRLKEKVKQLNKILDLVTDIVNIKE